jgi:hypothetical protein
MKREMANPIITSVDSNDNAAYRVHGLLALAAPEVISLSRLEELCTRYR